MLSLNHDVVSPEAQANGANVPAFGEGARANMASLASQPILQPRSRRLASPPRLLPVRATARAQAQRSDQYPRPLVTNLTNGSQLGEEPLPRLQPARRGRPHPMAAGLRGAHDRPRGRRRARFVAHVDRDDVTVAAAIGEHALVGSVDEPQAGAERAPGGRRRACAFTPQAWAAPALRRCADLDVAARTSQTADRS